MSERRWKARVITCSDSAARGRRVDTAGPAARDVLQASGRFDVDAIIVVPDEIETIGRAIVEAIDDDHVALVVTTGGTGVAPADVTPEATDLVTSRGVPGLGELMRARSLAETPMAALSRAQAAIRGSSLVVNLPGSERGAAGNLEAIVQILPHALELLSGEPIERHPV